MNSTNAAMPPKAWVVLWDVLGVRCKFDYKMPPMPLPPPLPVSSPPHQNAKTSAITAGWICFAIGTLTFWIFGLGFIFFSISITLAVVAMCYHEVGKGIALLMSTLVMMFICAALFFLVLSGTVLGITAKALQEVEKKMEEMPPPNWQPVP